MKIALLIAMVIICIVVLSVLYIGERGGVSDGRV